jgi:uncharacterized membrane protein
MRKRSRREPASSGTRLTAMAVVGAVAGLAGSKLTTPLLGPLLGWDVAALFFLIWAWWTMWPRDAADTARLAVREDPNRPLTDAMLLGACLASLLGIGVVLANAGSERGFTKLPQVVLEMLSVLLSWTVIHTVHTARYARIYYSDSDGGVEFHQDEPPQYRDFAYMSFTVGMTFQVSDTNLRSTAMRTTALRHALLSYLFGAVIIAATINLVASLAR